MGTWGTKLNQNDDALDFVCTLIPIMLKQARPFGSKAYLVVAQFIIDYCWCGDDKTIEEIISAIDCELKIADNWREDEKEERKEMLMKMKTSLESLKS